MANLPDIERALEELDAAHKELCEAVKRQWDGKSALTLSIPADEKRDTDLIIGAALRNARALIAEVIEACQEAFEYIDAQDWPTDEVLQPLRNRLKTILTQQEDKQHG